MKLLSTAQPQFMAVQQVMQEVECAMKSFLFSISEGAERWSRLIAGLFISKNELIT